MSTDLDLLINDWDSTSNDARLLLRCGTCALSRTSQPRSFSHTGAQTHTSHSIAHWPSVIPSEESAIPSQALSHLLVRSAQHSMLLIGCRNLVEHTQHHLRRQRILAAVNIAPLTAKSMQCALKARRWRVSGRNPGENRLELIQDSDRLIVEQLKDYGSRIGRLQYTVRGKVRWNYMRQFSSCQARVSLYAHACHEDRPTQWPPSTCLPARSRADSTAKREVSWPASSTSRSGCSRPLTSAIGTYEVRCNTQGSVRSRKERIRNQTNVHGSL